MKIIAVALLLLSGVTLSRGQGTVTFVNSGAFPTPADRLVYFDDGSGCRPLVGTNYVAQLYYGADATSLQAHTAAPSRFRVPTTSSPGTWSGGTRTLTGFLAGSVVTMQVLVWDMATGSTWETAQSRVASDVFTYTVPQVGSPANQFLMDNFRGIACVPEPQAFMLVMFSVVGSLLWFHRRSKQSSTS